jgi:site-specific recombinase XerD
MHLWRRIGRKPKCIAQYRILVEQILKCANTADCSALSADLLKRLANVYARRRHLDPHKVLRHWFSAFRAFAWGLQQLGKSTGPLTVSKSKAAIDPTIAAFHDYGSSLCWSANTLRSYERTLNELRQFQVRRRRSWPEPSLKDIDRFLQAAAAHWKRTTVGGAAGTFRAWLRFLFVTGRSKRDLSSSVALPPSIAFPRPARALPWSVIRQFRRGIDTTTTVGKRDLAQYLLLCAYGLSNAEITNMKIDDIDWDARILHICRVKNGSAVDLPLSDAVAKAIAVYIEQGRPSSTCRNVFVQHCIPFGPLQHSAVGQRVKCWAETAGLKLPFQGVHIFRHSFATYQLERGVSLKMIGDILGHCDTQTTSIYVRSALERLRRLALPVPR